MYLRYYLCIWSYNSNIYHKLPNPIEQNGDHEEVEFDEVESCVMKKRKNKLTYKDRIIKKKQQQRNKVILLR